MPQYYDAVLFDLDGTLSDSIGLILESYRHTMNVHLGKELPDELWLSGVGTPLDIQLAEFARKPEEIPAMRKTYSDYYVERHDANVGMFPGAVEAIAELKTRGIKVGVVTSKSRLGLERTLRLHQLMEFFDVMVSADDTKEGKPHPEPVLFALSQIGIEPNRACFVGDSTHDLKAGNAAGVDSIAVEWGPYPTEALEKCHPKKWLKATSEIVSLGEPSP